MVKVRCWHASGGTQMVGHAAGMLVGDTDGRARCWHASGGGVGHAAGMLVGDTDGKGTLLAC